MEQLEVHCSYKHAGGVKHTVLLGSETWTPYKQRRLNNSHRHSPRLLLGITCRARITQTALAERAKPPSVRSHVQQRMMDESRRTFRMLDCHLAGDKVATGSYAVGTSPNKTISSWTSMLSAWKMQFLHRWNHRGSAWGSKEVKEEATITEHQHVVGITRVDVRHLAPLCWSLNTWCSKSKHRKLSLCNNACLANKTTAVKISVCAHWEQSNMKKICKLFPSIFYLCLFYTSSKRYMGLVLSPWRERSVVWKYIVQVRTRPADTR